MANMVIVIPTVFEPTLPSRRSASFVDLAVRILILASLAVLVCTSVFHPRMSRATNDARPDGPYDVRDARELLEYVDLDGELVPAKQ